MDDEAIEQVPALVTALYRIVAELESLFPGRHFTPDGHLVGSLGEAFAAYAFDLELTTASAKSTDALTADGRRVEIKATQRNAVALTADPEPMPDILIVLRLLETGSAELVYNGPAAPAWHVAGGAQKNGQRRISLSRLRTLDGGGGLRLVRALP